MPPDNLKVWTVGGSRPAHSRPADNTVPVEWKKNQQAQATTPSVPGGVSLHKNERELSCRIMLLSGRPRQTF